MQNRKKIADCQCYKYHPNDVRRQHERVIGQIAWLFGGIPAAGTLFHAFYIITNREKESIPQTVYTMKRMKMMLVAAVATLALSGCGIVGMVGTVYHGTTEPVAVTSNVIGTKVGTAKCVSVLGIVAVGDGGINMAAKDGNITQISHVDVKTLSILGLFTVKKYYVYGE